MKILLAPSESKKIGGEDKLVLDNLFLNQLTPVRKKLIEEYQKIINSNNIESKKEILGLKKIGEVKEYEIDISTYPTLKAVLRYSGVAFNYLDYNNLNEKEQNYIDENVIIFSNLFGPIKAKDKIPLYKLKQGKSLNSIKVENKYKKHISSLLDKYLENEDILDLRASFYNKFYTPSKKYITLKFIKNAKVVSHWAKAYRGLILRYIAQNSINSIEEFLKLQITNLNLLEIREQKNKIEIIFEIEDI